MSFAFTRQPLAAGQYEPEGIYLTAPFTGTGHLLHDWGAYANVYANHTYNGVPLKGYIGLAFSLAAGAEIVAADDGQVSEISQERDGFEKYIKLQHWWGESLYAFLHAVHVESGQKVVRGHHLASAALAPTPPHPHLHFAIRVTPYNRFDGWGGFTDPSPYLPPDIITRPAFDAISSPAVPPTMPIETPRQRRP